MSDPKADRQPFIVHPGDYSSSLLPYVMNPRSTMVSQTKKIRKRRRPAHSCVECRRRKVRCDRNKPCAQCSIHNFVPCVYEDGNNSPRNSTESPMIACEDTQPRPGQADSPRLPTSGEDPPRASAPAGPIRGTVSKTRIFGHGHWMNTMSMASELSILGPMPQFKNRLFQQGNEAPHDEVSRMMMECKTLARDIKRDRPNRRSLPAGLYRTFPTRKTIDELVQLYFTTTETCYPILHYPTFMTEYLACIDALEGAKGSFLVELLLLMSVTGMMHGDDDVREEVGSKTPTWLHISQTWLSAPTEKDRLTIRGIQVHCLLLLARQVNRVGADIVWISAGSLIRMAMQMGLHQDPDHLGDMSTGQKEIRRQLWYTILEMNVQAALDSGMAPMINHADYNTHPPSGQNCDTDSKIWQDHSEQTNAKVQPQRSFQHFLAESLPLRIRAVIVINSLQEEPEYDQVLALGNELSLAFQKAAVAIEHEVSHSQKPPSQFTQSFCSHLLRRFLLCLHFMYAVKAKQNQLYTHSHKVCLEVALDLISFLDDHLYGRLLVNGGGMFRDIITRGALMIYLELHSSLNSSISILAKSRHRAHQQMLINDAHRVVQYARDRMSHGETNVKGYMFLSMATAHIEALLNGSSGEQAMSNAAKDSLNTCHRILTELASRKENHVMDPGLESWIYYDTVTPPAAVDREFEFFSDDTLNFDFENSNLFHQWID